MRSCEFIDDPISYRKKSGGKVRAGLLRKGGKKLFESSRIVYRENQQKNLMTANSANQCALFTRRIYGANKKN